MPARILLVLPNSAATPPVSFVPDIGIPYESHKKIPSSGRIFLIKNSEIIDRDLVIEKWKETEFLKSVNQKSRGWLIDILNCVDLIPNRNFRLEDVYKFEAELKLKYPNNHFIKDKIRQQLQVLRDKGVIEFVSRGTYKKKN